MELIELSTNPAVHSDEYTVAVAALMATAGRILNYATGPHVESGLSEVSTVYEVLDSLYATAARMPQLLMQMTDELKAKLAAGTLDCSNERDLSTEVGHAEATCKKAASAALDLAEALSAAQIAVKDLTGR
jgi:hypothetical protein